MLFSSCHSQGFMVSKPSSAIDLSSPSIYRDLAIEALGRCLPSSLIVIWFDVYRGLGILVTVFMVLVVFFLLVIVDVSDY